jgi:hypothetical protein
MRVTDAELRGLLTRRADSRDACPSPEALGAAAGGRLPEREAVAEHLTRCQDCAEELRLGAPPGSWARDAAARLRPPSRWKAWPAWAAAAAVLLAVPFVMRMGREPGPVTLRAQPDVEIRSLLPDGSPVSRERCLLRWSGLGPGARYSISVLGKDLSPLAGADGLERPAYQVPAEALKALPPGGEIVWSVQARRTDGLRVASPTFITRIE